MGRILLVAATTSVLLALGPAAAAHASEDCTVDLRQIGSGAVEAVPSPACGPINVAAFSYASTAPGTWSPGSFPFERTLPQSLASSASGVGVLQIDLPCGLYQVDAWLASGPAVPGAVTATFLRDNGSAILATYRRGLHGERVCSIAEPASTNGPSATAGGPETLGGFLTGPPSGPFLSGAPAVVTALGGPPEVRSDRTSRTPPGVVAKVLGSTSSNGGAGRLVVAMVVAAVLVAVIFRSPLPSASTEGQTP